MAAPFLAGFEKMIGPEANIVDLRAGSPEVGEGEALGAAQPAGAQAGNPVVPARDAGAQAAVGGALPVPVGAEV